MPVPQASLDAATAWCKRLAQRLGYPSQKLSVETQPDDFLPFATISSSYQCHDSIVKIEYQLVDRGTGVEPTISLTRSPIKDSSSTNQRYKILVRRYSSCLGSNLYITKQRGLTEICQHVPGRRFSNLYYITPPPSVGLYLNKADSLSGIMGSDCSLAIGNTANNSAVSHQIIFNDYGNDRTPLDQRARLVYCAEETLLSTHAIIEGAVAEEMGFLFPTSAIRSNKLGCVLEEASQTDPLSQPIQTLLTDTGEEYTFVAMIPPTREGNYFGWKPEDVFEKAATLRLVTSGTYLGSDTFGLDRFSSGLQEFAWGLEVFAKL